jgi:hypothetical protein
VAIASCKAITILAHINFHTHSIEQTNPLVPLPSLLGRAGRRSVLYKISRTFFFSRFLSKTMDPLVRNGKDEITVSFIARQFSRDSESETVSANGRHLKPANPAMSANGRVGESAHTPTPQTLSKEIADDLAREVGGIFWPNKISRILLL